MPSSAPPPKRQCANCGLLTDTNLSHLDLADRSLGYFSADALPQCLFGAADLRREFYDIEDSDGPEAARAEKRVIDKPRECQAWTPYVNGFTPQWHAEQVRIEGLEEQRRKWQEDLEESRKRWEKDIADSDRRWQKSLRWEGRLWQLLILAVTLVGIAMSVRCDNGVIPLSDSDTAEYQTTPTP